MAKQIITVIKWAGACMVALAVYGFINIMLIAAGASY